MLRIGKNPKEQSDNEHTSERQEAPSHSPQQPYAPATSPAPRADFTPTPVKAMTESENIAREIKEGTLSGFVGSGTELTGETTFKAMLRVDGHLSGKISSSSGTLIVGATGKIDANVEVAVAVVHGTVNGDIIASQRLELGRASKVNGNIQTPSLVIEQGGIFEGNCKMVKMTAALDKSRDEKRVPDTKAPLDTTSMKPTPTDPKPAEMPNYAAKSAEASPAAKLAN
ncbi:MAG TPA: polymer-forming cytoskeletal protein [Pyrinomonadaceae bacterium]|nr:polymer-forming cytoskeletal protein [Pyrinomonadaceae bacterium]